MKALSLFSGMGGDTLGITQANIEVKYFSEYDKSSIYSHQKNFPNSIILKDENLKNNEMYDIRKIDNDIILKIINEKIDLIFAGFPCQGFSHAGKKIPTDPRNTLFKEFVRITELLKPKYIIGENVSGLLKRKTEKGEYFIDIIKDSFEKIGYNITYKVVNAVDYFVPQERKRLIIFGISQERNERIEDNIFNKISNKELNLKKIIKYSSYGIYQVSPNFFEECGIPLECILINNDDYSESNNYHPFLENKDYSFGKRSTSTSIEIIDIRKPSKTIICTYDHQPRLVVAQRNCLGDFIRTLNINELKQIQGFPEDYSICGNVKDQIKQIGNAVPPPIIKQIINNYLKK